LVNEEGSSVRVQLRAPLVLNLGVFNVDDVRVTGGLGASFEPFKTVVSAEWCDGDEEVEVTCLNETEQCDQEELKRTIVSAIPAVEGCVRITVEETPPHALILDKRLQLGIPAAISIGVLMGFDVDPVVVAKRIGLRGYVTMGLWPLYLGGLAVAGGESEQSVYPLIARLPIPVTWRFVVVTHRECFEKAVPSTNLRHKLDEESLQRAAYIVLNKLLPALSLGDVKGFGNALTLLHRRVSSHLLPHTLGGYGYELEELVEILLNNGALGVGWSYPLCTVFGVVLGEGMALDLIANVEKQVRRAVGGDLDIELLKPVNQGYYANR